jgi:outer membrane protein
MKHLVTYAVILSLVLMTYNAKAQEANKSSFSLQEAIEYSMKHSSVQMNAELDLKNAEYKKKEVTGLGLPQITGSIDVKDYIKIPTSLIPGDFVGQPGTYIPVQFGTKYNATAGVSASQLIFSSDYIFALKASKEFMNLSRIGVNRSKADLVAQVSKAYYTVLITKQRINLLDANISRVKKGLGDTKAANAQGLTEGIDVEQREVQYNNLTTEREKMIQLIAMAESILKFQMGYNVSDAITLSDSLNVNSESFQPLSVGKADFSQRPDYQFLKANQTLLDIDVKRLKWGYLPTLAAYGSYQLNSQRNQFDFFSTDKNNPTKQWFKIALIGATLNLNIFDGLQRHYKIQQAKVAAMKNTNLLRLVEQQTDLESNTSVIAYNNAYATLLSQKRNIELAQHVVEVTQKKYINGVGTNLEVVMAEASLLEAQTNYYGAVYDVLSARIDYQKAIGALAK